MSAIAAAGCPVFVHGIGLDGLMNYIQAINSTNFLPC
jgi:hypothetical protein